MRHLDGPRDRRGLGSPGRGGQREVPSQDALRQALLGGSLTLELQPLNGAGGSWLQDIGGSYRIRSGPWTGLLAREAGGPWRMLRLGPAKS